MQYDGHKFMLRYLPYLETIDGRDAKDVIGWEPAFVRRGNGYGRWEEGYDTLEQARARMHQLDSLGIIEDAEIREDREGLPFGILVDEWSSVQSTRSHDDDAE